jgi:hypothetical protein
MAILVSDTSVLIDLERGQLLDPCFHLPFEFAVPDLLYKRELAEYGGAELVARGLRVEELTGAELTVAQAVRASRPKLSLPDAYAFSLASRRPKGYRCSESCGLPINCSTARLSKLPSS